MSTEEASRWYRPGEPVKVWYNPQNPSESLAEAAYPDWGSVGIFGIVSLVCAVWVWPVFFVAGCGGLGMSIVAGDESRERESPR